MPDRHDGRQLSWLGAGVPVIRDPRLDVGRHTICAQSSASPTRITGPINRPINPNACARRKFASASIRGAGPCALPTAAIEAGAAIVAAPVPNNKCGQRASAFASISHRAERESAQAPIGRSEGDLVKQHEHRGLCGIPATT